MPQSLSKVVVHLVFSTKHRQEMIGAVAMRPLHAYLAGACNAIGSTVIRGGGTSNHVHLACTLPRTMTLSKLLEEIKKSSSVWMKTAEGRCADFAWQAGYGAFSVGASQVDGLVRYLEPQHEHHRARSFEDEFLDLLGRYGVEYDERYLWD
jgi:putative transposase